MKSRVGHLGSHLVERIVDLAKSCPDAVQADGQYSNSIEYALLELIRIQLRQMAQSREDGIAKGWLFEAALRSVFATVETALEKDRMGCDLSAYEAQAIKQLKPAASELETLSNALSKSRHQGKLVPLIAHDIENESRFELRRLGFAESVDGLLVVPSESVQEIDIQRLQSLPNCRIDGKWFPYEVHQGDFMFVIDDDGSIFVSVENLPPRIMAEAQKQLEAIAKALYFVEQPTRIPVE